MKTQPTGVQHYTLKRRGFDLGSVTHIHQIDPLNNWHAGEPVLLNGICADELKHYQDDIAHSDSFYQSILNGEECDQLLEQSPRHPGLTTHFESLGSSINEGDDQEIETVSFDAIANHSTVAEDLWMKVSWLSFYESDASLRFRFSFGVDFAEDVAADPHRQHYASLLTETVFPESRLITHNPTLKQALQETLQCDSIKFVERIIYFNAPEGGAYLHHDRERNHTGVVYAQLSGATFWLALPKRDLMHEIQAFVQHCQTSKQWPTNIKPDIQTKLIALLNDPDALSAELENFSNSTLTPLLNETERFVQQLIAHGHGRVVTKGDMLLLPQETEQLCCWHTVFCLGNETGQALSFAIRT